MTAPLPVLIERLAHERGIDLPPDWTGEAIDPAALRDSDGLHILAENAGWDAPKVIGTRPRANLAIENAGSGSASPVASDATISPMTGPILNPWPDPPPTIQTLDAAGCRSMM